MDCFILQIVEHIPRNDFRSDLMILSAMRIFITIPIFTFKVRFIWSFFLFLFPKFLIYREKKNISFLFKAYTCHGVSHVMKKDLTLTPNHL
jgi:hypothetical protein